MPTTPERGLEGKGEMHHRPHEVQLLQDIIAVLGHSLILAKRDNRKPSSSLFAQDSLETYFGIAALRNTFSTMKTKKQKELPREEVGEWQRVTEIIKGKNKKTGMSLRVTLTHTDTTTVTITYDHLTNSTIGRDEEWVDIRKSGPEEDSRARLELNNSRNTRRLVLLYTDATGIKRALRERFEDIDIFDPRVIVPKGLKDKVTFAKHEDPDLGSYL